MDLTSIIVAGLAFLGTLIGAYLSNSKTTALVTYRLEQLEKKVQLHNSVVERVYELEKKVAVIKEEIKN